MDLSNLALCLWNISETIWPIDPEPMVLLNGLNLKVLAVRRTFKRSDRPGKFRFESSGSPDAGIPECAAHGQTW